MQPNDFMRTSHSTGHPRREFIKKTATAAAAVAATSTVLKTTVYGQAPSAGRVIGANDCIGVAVIGTGMGIGMNHFMGIQDKAGENNVSLLAGCDLADHRRKWMKGEIELYGGKVK